MACKKSFLAHPKGKSLFEDGFSIEDELMKNAI
jgi:hypothetical protein